MSKDWLRQYNKGIRRYQAGGPTPPPDAGPAGPPPGPGPEGPGGPGGPAGELEAMLMEYAQTRDPQLAVAICDMLVEMLMAQAGGGAPGGPPPGPEGGAPMGGPPMGRKGMKFRRGPVFKK